MMLSQDLSSLSRMTFLAMEGESLPDLKNAMLLVAERIQDAANQAAHLEAAQVGDTARPVLIDLSDDKIALFPVVKRPLPRPSMPGPSKGGDVA